MGQMTKIQFDTIRSLALAYGHEWAVGLDFSRCIPRDPQPGDTVTTLGDMYRGYAANPEHESREDWARWVDLHDRISAGHVPTTEEIERLATPLFDDDHFPSTPYVALDHETCTRRTRWLVAANGSVRFEFARGRYVDGVYAPLTPLCHALVRPDRTAVVTSAIPVSEWTADDIDRVSRALVACKVRARVARDAINGAQVDRAQKWVLYGVVDESSGERRGWSTHRPFASHGRRIIVLSWDGERISVLAQMGHVDGTIEDLAYHAGVITYEHYCVLARERVARERKVFEERERADRIARAAERAREERRKPVPPTSRIVGGTRRRRNARRRVSQ